MEYAPSVSYPVGRPLFAGLAAVSVWLAGLAVTLTWWAQADAAGWRQMAAGAALVFGGAWALLSWHRLPRGDLSWEGGGWTGPRATGLGSLEVTLDLQRLLLVRWRTSDGGGGWLWLERRRAPARWPDLRRAVYSRPRAQALPPAHPPAAIP